MKKLSLFLVLAMLLSMLAGCAKAPASESLPEDTNGACHHTGGDRGTDRIRRNHCSNG